jgi:hypothetical protein
MTFTAGQKLAASDLDQILTTSSQLIGGAQTTGSITLTTSTVDLTGSSVTFTTTYANTKFALWAVFDVQAGSSGGSVTFIGTAVVDGTTLSGGEAHLSAGSGTRVTLPQMWIGTLAAAGSHTIKLQGTGNTYQTLGTHTKWHCLVFGP